LCQGTPGDRLRIELVVFVVADVFCDRRNHLPVGTGWDRILQGGEFLGVDGRDDVGARREHLADFDERRPEREHSVTQTLGAFTMLTRRNGTSPTGEEEPPPVSSEHESEGEEPIENPQKTGDEQSHILSKDSCPSIKFPQVDPRALPVSDFGWTDQQETERSTVSTTDWSPRETIWKWTLFAGWKSKWGMHTRPSTTRD
jgi:hypothetical protein